MSRMRVAVVTALAGLTAICLAVLGGPSLAEPAYPPTQPPETELPSPTPTTTVLPTETELPSPTPTETVAPTETEQPTPEVTVLPTVIESPAAPAQPLAVSGADTNWLLVLAAGSALAGGILLWATRRRRRQPES